MKFYIQNENSKYQFVVKRIIEEKKREIFSFFNINEIELSFNIYIYSSIENLEN